MDFSNMANMKLSDFENIGKEQYNKGFAAALTIVVNILNKPICEEYLADGECEHDICPQNTEIAEGLKNAIRNVQ